MSALENSDTITPIDSTARNGDSVSRRRFQKGSVFLNRTKTLWLGTYAEYVLDSHGAESRNRKQVVLCPVKIADNITRKREAQKLLQPYLDGVNTSLATPVRERKTITLAAFVQIWERDYLSLCKRSTQSGMRGHLRRIEQAFGQKDIRQIGAGDLQRVISTMTAAEFNPKTIRNLWGTVRLIWQAALTQKYVDSVLPKPKLPRKARTKPKFFLLPEVARIIAASQGEHRVFYWLAAETGLRAGELAGLRLSDIDTGCTRLTVSQSVWNGKEQDPKTANAVRTLALSPQLAVMVWDQMANQRIRGHEFLFSASTGNPCDMNLYRKRKLRPLLSSLEIKQAGFHAFRHFNVSLLVSLRVPLKAVQERAGHALTGSFTLDVYGHALDWSGNVEAARLAGNAIEEAVEKADSFDGLTAVTVEKLPMPKSEALQNA